MKPYWCRFYVLTREMRFFEYHGPWWVSGCTMDEDEQTIVCAAVMAPDSEGAYRTLEACFDEDRSLGSCRGGPDMVRWDDGSELPQDWQPEPKGSGARFQRAAWMRWPWPESESGCSDV